MAMPRNPHPEITIPWTTNGPPGSGHGGACAGMFANGAGRPDARVRLHAPIPLETALTVQVMDDMTTIADEATTIATVHKLDGPLAVGQFGRVSKADVEAAEGRFLDHHDGVHMAPTCFACGNARPDGLGLGLRPAEIPDTGLGVAAWRPNLNGAVPNWLVWAALDCPSGFPALSSVNADEAVVTGELSVETRCELRGDGDYQILGRRTGRRGRVFTTEAAIVDEAGFSCAVAVATWIVVPLARLHAQGELTKAV